ncbi:Na+/H+ antiporter NhaA [Alteromonas aestuariivivens]|uniref:Na(+)/H(+) antiporter NhaA n=1 Tax=Alteromonas aestuariivivens TaxID=1938339 RepID=A0A3D8M4F7_9ALTE|nr:Na+/H+ antiporter NhaA [Alteromonas aestuariivivens]RDV24521.1 Na+/H+ antiporter NhaA [Alteromonas aestuariivivens]
MRIRKLTNRLVADNRGDASQLPQSPIDWLSHPLGRFFKIEAAAGLVLLFFTLLALYLANSPLGSDFAALWSTSIAINLGDVEFERSLRAWINDAVMTLFFFLIALELKRELVLGELRKPRLAMLSVSAALGGMIVPAGIYLLFQFGEVGQHGWGTVMATDTAFVIGCLALLGKRIPKSLRVFMLSLAIVDDLGAILVVALGYGKQLDLFYIVTALSGFVMIKAMSLLGIRSIALFFIAGGAIWLLVDASGIHPTVTGVILGLMTPTNKWVSDDRLHNIMDSVVASPPGERWAANSIDRKVLKTAEAAAREALSPVERLELMMHPWVGFVVMPLFAFANAGIPLTMADFPVSIGMAVFIGFVLGKPVGICLFSWLAVRLKLALLPPDLPWLMIAGGGMLAGIGFTMAMFIANLAFSAEHINAVKLGILSASVFSALFGLIVLWLATRSENPAREDFTEQPRSH